ncbi:hypothetical protein [uncultured Bacteroides sp.]|uniref:hypothetical protein n=1 Tax=uncultured Bacteroides sp. TaxID=162156 RepID=UPI0025ADB47E|nr:hypothetical protein [uncultured Bacteroides sp.]
MKQINLESLSERAYNIACSHGFHDVELSDEHFLMLAISELSEAIEADRKGKHADVGTFKASLLGKHMCSDESWFKVLFDELIKDTVEDEFADVAIRLLDLAGLRKLYLHPMTVPVQKSCIANSMTVFCFDVVRVLYEKVDLEDRMCAVISWLFEKCENEGIDLLWHIEQKMQYNDYRDKMHGKKY